MPHMNRRTFLKITGFAAGAAALPRGAWAADAPAAVASLPEVRLWPGDAPNVPANPPAEGIVNERIVNVTVPTLRVCLPEKGKANGTAIIVCSGGGYHHLAVELHAGRVAARMNPEGIAVFGLKYRLSPPSTNVVRDTLEDGKRAVRLVRSRAAEWGVNPNRIGVLGYSAGSNLTLNLAANFDAGDPAAADPIDRLSSRPDFVALMCPWAGKSVRVPYTLRKDSPPAFICHAKDDKSAPYALAQEIEKTLKGLGVPVHLETYETGGHGAFTVGENVPSAKWPDVFLPWLRGLKMLPEGAGK